MNKKYEPLELKIVLLTSEDVLNTSGDEDFELGENQLPIIGGEMFK